MNNMIKVYTGSALNVEFLKSKLSEIGIHGLVKNDFQSGIAAGFGGGIPADVEFYIEEADLPKVRQILSDLSEGD